MDHEDILTGYLSALRAPAPPPVSRKSSAPSFDCSKVTTDVEKLVCSDEELAGLDRKMAGLYQKAVESYPQDELSALRATQRGWIKCRDACWKAEELRDCVEYAYRTRIVELQIGTGQLEAPAPVEYICKGIEPVVATHYSETDPPSAVITVGNDQVIAFVARSGSGARYTADNVELWEHQGEATLDWFGTRYRCRIP